MGWDKYSEALADKRNNSGELYNALYEKNKHIQLCKRMKLSPEKYEKRRNINVDIMRHREYLHQKVKTYDGNDEAKIHTLLNSIISECLKLKDDLNSGNYNNAQDYIDEALLLPVKVLGGNDIDIGVLLTIETPETYHKELFYDMMREIRYTK